MRILIALTFLLLTIPALSNDKESYDTSNKFAVQDSVITDEAMLQELQKEYQLVIKQIDELTITKFRLEGAIYQMQKVIENRRKEK